MAAAVLAAWGLAFAAMAAPAPWYYWRSKIDGARVCAQTSPGPGCQPRRKVLIVPVKPG